MAVNIFTGATSNNWNTATNWSLGTVPTATDGHVATFDATSPNFTLNTNQDCNAISFSGYTNFGTWTYTLSVYGDVTLQSDIASRVSTTSIINIRSNCNFNSNSGIFPDIRFDGTLTITLLSDLNTSSQLFFPNALQTVTINGSYYLNCTGSFFILNRNTLNGSCLGLKMTGTGIYDQNGSPTMPFPVIFDTTGIITVLAMYILNTSFTVINAELKMNPTSSITLSGTCSISINNASSNVLSNLIFGTGTFSLLTDVYTILSSYGTSTINGNNLYIYESCNLPFNITVSGTTKFHFIGEQVSWYQSSLGKLVNDLVINCGILWIGSIRGKVTVNTLADVRKSGGTTTYIKGNIKQSPLISMLFDTSNTLINFHKANLSNVKVGAGVTLTMNEFFCGRPEVKTKVVSTSTVNYNITFTNTVAKKAFHVNVKNCTCTIPNQLNVINRDGNGGNNIGIMFGQRGLIGFPVNMFPAEKSYPTDNGFLSTINN